VVPLTITVFVLWPAITYDAAMANTAPTAMIDFLI
jgi:hypothetical protein